MATLRSTSRAALVALPLLAAACADRPDATPAATTPDAPGRPAGTVAVLHCNASPAKGEVSCDPPAAPGGSAGDARTLGGQGVYVRLTSSAPTYVGGTFAFGLTVQNLLTLPMATADGASGHTGGVRVFFQDVPQATAGTGDIVVANPTGEAVFTGSQPQPYFQYGGDAGGDLGADGILVTGEVSAAKTWQLSIPATVSSFAFTLLVSTETPGGAVQSAAPAVASVSPATLVPGTSAVISGARFNTTPASNAVTIGGVAATVTGATADQLTVTVPCVPSGSVAVQVTSNGMKGVATSRPLLVPQRSLAVGEAVVVTDAAQVGCNELVPTGGNARYVVSVYNATTSTSSNAPFWVSPDGAADVPQPAVSAVDAPLAAVAHPRAWAQEGPLSARGEAAHLRLLEENGRELERLRARFARDPRMQVRRSVAAADPVPPPATRTVRIPRIDGANFCRTYTEVNATRVYSGSKVAIYEDADSTPVALRAANNPKMRDYYLAIGQQFDADMEPVVRNHFGDVLRRDAVTDNNGVLVAVFTPVINRRSPGVAGFVVSCDQFPNDSASATPTNSSSNFGEYFYAYQPTDSTGASGYATFTPDSWYWSIRATFVHESKHVASFAARVANGAPNESAWLEEGTARHSEELWARSAVYNVGWKANTGYGSAAAPGSIYCDWRREATVAGGAECLASNPRRPSLNVYRHFGSLYNFLRNGRFYSVFGATVDDTGANWYATSWSLVRYAADRYGTSDAQFLTALNQSTTTSTTNLAQRAGVSAVQLMGEWSLALAMDDYPGMPVGPSTPQIPTWNMRDIFAGMNADPLLGFGEAWPVRFAHSATLGSTAPLNVPTLRGGGVAWLQFSGAHTAPHLLHLRGGSNTAPATLASTVRIAIGRVE
jgi:hypothetical protein